MKRTAKKENKCANKQDSKGKKEWWQEIEIGSDYTTLHTVWFSGAYLQRDRRSIKSTDILILLVCLLSLTPMYTWRGNYLNKPESNLPSWLCLRITMMTMHFNTVGIFYFPFFFVWLKLTVSISWNLVLWPHLNWADCFVSKIMLFFSFMTTYSIYCMITVKLIYVWNI